MEWSASNVLSLVFKVACSHAIEIMSEKVTGLCWSLYLWHQTSIHICKYRCHGLSSAMKFIFWSANSQHLRMWPYLQVGSLQIYLKWSITWVRYIWCHYKKWRLERTRIPGAHYVKIGVLLPQTKGLGKRHRTNSSLVPSEGVWSWQPRFGLLPSRTLRQQISVI